MENFKTKYIMTDQPKNTKQGKSGMTHNPNPTSQIQIGLNSSSDFVPSARRIQEVLFPSQYEISHMLDLLELKVDSINQRLHDNRQRSFQFSKYLEKILTQGVPNHMNPFHQNYAFKQQSSQQSSSLVGSAGSVISAAKVGPTTTPTTTTTSTATGTTSATTPSVTAPTSTVSSAVASIGSTSNTTTTTTTISSSTRPVLTAITNRPLTAGKQSSQQGSEKYKVNLEKLHEISKENEVRIMAATLSRSPDHLELVSKCTKIGLKIQNKNYRDGRAVYQMMKDEVLSLLTYSASLPSASTATSNTVFALPTTSANTTSATPSSTPSLTALTTQLGTTVTSKNSNLASSVVALTKPSVSIISLTPTFLENQESMNQLRPTMLKEIRRRKLQVRQAWELLGDHYLHVMHKWTKHIEAIADEDEAHEQMKLRAINQSNRFAPSVNPTPSSSGNLNTSSSTTSVSASNNSIGNSLSQNQENQRSSVRLSALNTPSSGPLIDPYTGNPFLPGQNVPLRPTADVIRSEYEQEKLILQLTATESLQVKIQKGKSDVPDMVSPWMRPDTFACAEYPVWPSSVREFVSGPLRKKVKKVGMTATGNVDVEMVGDRNITGTVMPKSDEFQISITLSEQVEELPLPTVEEFRRVSVGMVPPITVTDSSSSRLTLDGRKQFCGLLDCKVICPYGCNCARQVDLKSRYERVWTDMEKCIFIDKFLQFPKNFYKISTFLTNRSTKDCIKFYYDSKATIPFKSLLREYENRRRNVRNTWSVSLSAAKAVGAQIYPSLDTDEREPFVELPLNDTICRSHMNQPMLLKRRLEEEEENEGVRKSTAKQLLATAVSEQRPTLLSTKPRLLTMLQYKIREKRQKMQDGIIPSDDEEDNDDHEDENNNNEKFTTMNKASISRSRTEDQDDVVNHDQRSQYSAFLLNRKQGIAHIIDKIDEIVPNASSNELISGAFATATMSISGTATEQQATLASSSVLFSSSSSFSAEITSKNHGSLPGTNKKQQEIATSLLSGVAKNVQLLPPIPYQKLLKLDSEKLTQINWMSGCGHTVPSNTTNHTVTSMSTSTAAGAYANSLMIPGQHLLNANSITTQSTNLHFAQLSNEGIRAAIAIAAAGAPVSYSNSTTAASKSSGQSIPRAMNNPRVVNPKPTLPPRTKHNLVTSGLSASVALRKASEDGIANVNSLANTAKTSNVMPSATDNATSSSTTGVDGSVSMDIVEDSMTNDPTSTEASADTSTVSPPNPASSTVQPIPEAQTATAPTTAAARLSQSIVAANKLNRGISRPIGASASTTASSITANRLKTPTTTTIGRTGPASSLLNRTATTTTTTTGTVNNISIDNSDTQPVSIPPTSDSNNNNTEAPVDENASSGAASSSHIAPSPTPVENEQTSINLSTDETATADVNDTNEDTIATGVNSTTEISILTVEDSTAVESHPASSEIVSENLTQTSVHVTESGQMDTEHVNQVTETISENVIDEKDI